MNDRQPKWDDLALFLTVARAGGLSAASRMSDVSPATIGRRMLALERSLGVDLFVRHSQGYELTHAARDLLPELEAVDERLERFFASTRPQHAPTVKVSAGSWTTLALLDALDSLLGSPADVHLQFVTTETVVSIAHREAVIGIRNDRPADPSLVVRQLRWVEFAPYAVEAAPECWVQTLADTPSARWVRDHQAGQILCQVSAPRNALDLALAGKGIVLLPTFIGERFPALKQTTACIQELSHHQWIVINQADRERPEVRRTIDRLCAVLE